MSGRCLAHWIHATSYYVEVGHQEKKNYSTDLVSTMSKVMPRIQIECRKFRLAGLAVTSVSPLTFPKGGLDLKGPCYYPLTFPEDGLDLCVPLTTRLTFPKDDLDLCVPVEDVEDEDSSLGPDSWLAAVLATVSQLDVVHPEGGEVAALAVPQPGKARQTSPRHQTWGSENMG